jgi:hypothetical protein
MGDFPKKRELSGAACEVCGAGTVYTGERYGAACPDAAIVPPKDFTLCPKCGNSAEVRPKVHYDRLH